MSSYKNQYLLWDNYCTCLFSVVFRWFLCVFLLVFVCVLVFVFVYVGYLSFCSSHQHGTAMSDLPFSCIACLFSASLFLYIGIINQNHSKPKHKPKQTKKLKTIKMGGFFGSEKNINQNKPKS